MKKNVLSSFEKYVILAKSVFSLSLLSFAFWALLTLANGAEIMESYPCVYFYSYHIFVFLCAISRVNRKIKNYISLIRQIHLRNQRYTCGLKQQELHKMVNQVPVGQYINFNVAGIYLFVFNQERVIAISFPVVFLSLSVYLYLRISLSLPRSLCFYCIRHLISTYILHVGQLDTHFLSR